MKTAPVLVCLFGVIVFGPGSLVLGDETNGEVKIQPETFKVELGADEDVNSVVHRLYGLNDSQFDCDCEDYTDQLPPNPIIPPKRPNHFIPPPASKPPVPYLPPHTSKPPITYHPPPTSKPPIPSLLHPPSKPPTTDLPPIITYNPPPTYIPKTTYLPPSASGSPIPHASTTIEPTKQSPPLECRQVCYFSTPSRRIYKRSLFKTYRKHGNKCKFGCGTPPRSTPPVKTCTNVCSYPRRPTTVTYTNPSVHIPTFNIV